MRDITYCINEKCTEKDCMRHLSNAPKEELILQGEFKDCENWESD